MNGLHELNNSQGHRAGDQMLKAAACVLQDAFGFQQVYRIGGDEFVAFVLDQQEYAVRLAVRTLSSRLESLGISISIGVQWQRQVPSMTEFLKAAEGKMYAEKQRHYQGRATGALRSARGRSAGA